MSFEENKINTIITAKTHRKIGYGVAAGHLLVVISVLTVPIILDWFSKEEKIETISVQLVETDDKTPVDNPSPDPDPANPDPPTGSMDSGEPEPEPEIEPEPQPQPQPQPQPKPTPQPKPKPVINRNLPRYTPVKVKPIAQAQVKPRSRPLPRTKPRTDNNRNRNRNANSNRQNERRGSNNQPGHNAPGGQRGSSGYDKIVSAQIHRMWVTPDRQRLGGREPEVTLKIVIAPNGRVTSKQIIRSSGVLAMDQSIRELLNALQFVKPPPDGRSHTLVFSLIAKNE